MIFFLFGIFDFAFSFLQDVLRETEDHDLGPAVTHFFNCLFGSCQAIGTKGTANNTQSRTTKKVHSK